MWVSDGEILNLDRHVLHRQDVESCVKFVTREKEPYRFALALALLNDLVRAEDRIYKDVVQPFIVAEWLAPVNLAVLKIRRDVAEVALSMLRRGWRYPADAAGPGEDGDAAVVRGLLQAEAALERIPGTAVEYDALVQDESALAAALTELYPGLALPRFRYVTDAFAQQRDEVLRRRATDEYRRVVELVEAERARLTAST